jgi:caa(3)-type oxidase subunit IV
MADTAAHAEHGDDHHHDIHSTNYVKIWAILLVLLVVSILGPLLEIKIVTLITAFGIAGVKASMVIHYFMHLTHEKPFVHYVLATAVAFMVLFFAGVSVDVLNHEGANWDNVAAKQEIERAEKEHAEGGGHHGEHDEAGDEAHDHPEGGEEHH